MKPATPVSFMSHRGPVHRIAKYAEGQIEIWLTPCIVSMPPPGSTCLLVPSNERLCGTQFSHFPVGGPTPSAPKIGERPIWNSSFAIKSSSSSSSTITDNTTAAQNILYPCEAVDGILTELGGTQQYEAIQKLIQPIRNSSSSNTTKENNNTFELYNTINDDEYPIRCPTGEARRVPTVGMLEQNFEALILAVAPFWKSRLDWEEQLDLAFQSSFQLASGILATPLLGAGTRGIPVPDAARIAAQSTATFFASTPTNDEDGNDHIENKDREIITGPLDIVRFSVQDEDIAEAIDEELSNIYG